MKERICKDCGEPFEPIGRERICPECRYEREFNEDEERCMKEATTVIWRVGRTVMQRFAKPYRRKPEPVRLRHPPPRLDEMETFELLEPGDCYIEDGKQVFTAQYLLRRGYCCGNICRHCPYGKDIQTAASGKRPNNTEGLGNSVGPPASKADVPRKRT